MKLFGQTPAEFFASKTNWVGITAIAVAIISYQTGIIDSVVFVQSILAGIATITVRDAIAKK